MGQTNTRRGLPTGIQRKHSRRCPAYNDRTARCRDARCTYQVQVGGRRDRQTRTFATLDAAKAWKNDQDRLRLRARVDVERAPTLREAGARWLTDAEAGLAIARGRKPYKAGTLPDYRRALEVELYPVLGDLRLDQITTGRLNALALELERRGLAASTVRNLLMPMRAVYRHALMLGWVTENPTEAMSLPTGSGRRTRVVAPERIPLYLDALEAGDRALWATAFYAGLRRGELMALRWADVDLAGGQISIDPEQGTYNPRSQEFGPPKSEAGVRRVAICGELRDRLLEHRASLRGRVGGFVFARGRLAGSCRRSMIDLPFNDSATGDRAAAAWADAGLEPVTLHDARHTFASMIIAAMAQRGVFNPKLLQAAMGHSSIQVTFDRYGHLFPGAEAELGSMLDAYLAGPADVIPFRRSVAGDA